MRKLISIGEALIDFIPSESGRSIKDVTSFSGAVGGAPANVAAVCAKLGGNSGMITQLGTDGFGDKIIQTLASAGVDCSMIRRTSAANTALAFVALTPDGGREFSFYRNPSADMLLEPGNIKKGWFDGCGILHFCSVALVESPMRYSHIKAIGYAKQSGAMISFDPNIRPALWKDEDECKATVREFLKYADIVKISDEELEFISGYSEPAKAFEYVFNCGAKGILYSQGKSGTDFITPSFTIHADAHPIKPLDTTGAGDSVIGAFLYKLCESDTADIAMLTQEQLKEFVEFANLYAENSITKHGAIPAYADMAEFKVFAAQYGVCV